MDPLAIGRIGHDEGDGDHAGHLERVPGIRLLNDRGHQADPGVERYPGLVGVVDSALPGVDATDLVMMAGGG